mgnify:CR=1 FL=1
MENYLGGGKIEIPENTDKEPSQLYINPSKFIKSEVEYQKWLKNNS